MSGASALEWAQPLLDPLLAPLPDPDDPLSPDAPLDTPTPALSAVQQLHRHTRPRPRHNG